MDFTVWIQWILPSGSRKFLNGLYSLDPVDFTVQIQEILNGFYSLNPGNFQWMLLPGSRNFSVCKITRKYYPQRYIFQKFLPPEG